MCTVLFIPADDRFYFASLRDEDPSRGKALSPYLTEKENASFLAPADPKAGGTWAGINSFGNTLILLNGGFTKHNYSGPYRKSRGLIVRELLQSVYPVAEWSVMDLENIEPFTLITWCEHNLYELVWDGHNKHREILDNRQPAIWSSSTLYDAQAKKIRQSLFDRWISGHPVIDAATLLQFFQSYSDKENGFLMHRSASLKTLSYSFMEYRPSGEVLYYYDDFTTALPQVQIMRTAVYRPDLSTLFPYTPPCTRNQISMPAAVINPFEYCSILVSIILGLGITQLLSAFSELLYHYKKVTFYWPQLLWVVFVLFLHIQDWFITYQLKDKPAWHFGELLFVLLYPIALFMVAKLLLPTNDNEENRHMKTYYMSQYPVLFVVMAITILLAILFNCWLLQEPLAEQAHLIVFFLAVLLIALFRISHPLVHQLMAVTVVLVTIISLFTEAESWVIK